MTGSRILVSACLLGAPVRYDGRAKEPGGTLLADWTARGLVVPFCPEVAGGLAVPRPPAEIEPGADAAAVAGGMGRILDINGVDVSAAFLAGARLAVEMARAEGCFAALLTEGSPSCGTTLVHDGTFSGRRIAGEGLTAHLLRRAGVEVFSPATMDLLARRLAARGEG